MPQELHPSPAAANHPKASGMSPPSWQGTCSPWPACALADDRGKLRAEVGNKFSLESGTTLALVM
jgi:hypothetical protein